ncbi:BA75_04442T0 [Komagataella pastoris]|uniref:BA75_04442T0 n=1 Tax=Komagataella pastoris TaxID=4922 RepID=A0A1B2JI13_PICPA|nr:BA75_04442T0 [Komagataella pastoris]
MKPTITSTFEESNSMGLCGCTWRLVHHRVRIKAVEYSFVSRFYSRQSSFFNRKQLIQLGRMLIDAQPDIKEIKSRCQRIISLKRIELYLSPKLLDIQNLDTFKAFEILITSCIVFNKPRIAFDVYIAALRAVKKLFHNNSPLVDQLLVKDIWLHMLVNSLLVNNPKFDLDNLSKVVKLASLHNSIVDEVSLKINDLPWMKELDNPLAINLKQFYFSDTQVNKILEKLTQMSDTPRSVRVKSEVFGFLVKSMTQHRRGKLSVVQENFLFKYSLRYISSNLKNNNLSSVYLGWSTIKTYYTKSLHEIQQNTSSTTFSAEFFEVLARSIRSFSKSKKYKYLVEELIEDLPVSACVRNPNLLESLMFHSTRHKNHQLAQVLLIELEHFQSLEGFTRGQLSSILSLYLLLNDNEGVQKVVAILFSHFGGLNHSEFNQITWTLLQTNNDLDNIWSMATSVCPLVAKSTFLTIINRMIDSHSINFDRIDQIYNLMQPILPRDDEFWVYYTTAYIKYVLKKFPLKYTHLVLSKSLTQLNGNTMHYYKRCQNPYMLPIHEVRLYIPSSIDSFVVESMLHNITLKLKSDQSTKQIDDIENLKGIKQWCQDYLRIIGRTTNEIRIDVAKSFHRKSRKESLLNINLLNKM